MRRNEREITDKKEIVDVLERCTTLRIALFDGEYPYLVPVSFGADAEGAEIVVYFHCALEGKKAECIKKNNKVAIEADIFYKTEPLGYGITARYESVIGTGEILEVSGEEAVKGLRCICTHYGYKDFAVEDCKSLSRTAVYKIVIKTLTGKRNLPTD